MMLTRFLRRAPLFALGVMLLCAPVRCAAGDLEDLLTRLDRIRIPGKDFSASIEIRHSPKPSQAAEVSVFKIFTRVPDGGGRKPVSTLMLCTVPAKDAGKRILFQDENSWFYDPKAKRPAKIAPGQLWSQPAAFDSPNWRLAEDFTATLAGRENIVCGDGETRNCRIVDLVPKSPSSGAPPRMRYWLDETGRYWRIEHYTASGRLFKTVDNIKYAGPRGEPRVSGMRVSSGLETAEATITKIEARSAPAIWFDPGSLQKIEF